MAEKKYEPPKCSNCGERLSTVYEIGDSAWDFNKETGQYEENTLTACLEVKCPWCGRKVHDVIEEGACNYQAEKDGDGNC